MADERPGLTEVRFEHTPNLPGILQHARVALAVTTYQAGKLVVVDEQARIHEIDLTTRAVEHWPSRAPVQNLARDAWRSARPTNQAA